MSKKATITIEKMVYREADQAVIQQAFQKMADTFTANEIKAIAKKLENPIVQMQIRSML